MLNNRTVRTKSVLFLIFTALFMLLNTGCRSAAQVKKNAILDGSKIVIKDKVENIVSRDGTKCTMVFEMEAEQANGIYKGKAMLQSIGVKDIGGEIPVSAMVGVVSKMEFSLALPKKEAVATDKDISLAPLADLDYEGSGTFYFIMTDIGFMALEEKAADDDIFIDIPYRVIVFRDTAVISFTSPDGNTLTFKGKFAPVDDLELAPLKVK